MRDTDPPDPAVRAVLHNATLVLRDISIAVDQASAAAL
jgi:hypothetical protein